MFDSVISNLDRVGTELILICQDFVLQNYSLLYKVDQDSGLIVIHKKLFYDSALVKWDWSSIRSEGGRTYIRLRSDSSNWKTVVVINTTDFSLLKAFDLKTTVSTWHAGFGVRADGLLFYGDVTPTNSTKVWIY